MNLGLFFRNKEKSKEAEPTHWHALNEDTLFEALESGKKGLTSYEAIKRQAGIGPNEIPIQRDESPFVIIFNQLLDPLVAILVIASGISLYLGSYLDTAVIVFVLIFNTVIGFTQEWRAEKSINSLKRLVHTWAKVKRDGKLRKVDASELVAGDVVEIMAGDRIPADVRIVVSYNFTTQESALTGESEPQIKSAEVIEKQDVLVSDRDNMAFMGTIATRGKAVGAVVAIGRDTQIGSIAQDIKEATRPITLFQKSIRKLGAQVLVFALLMSLLIFGIGVERGRELADMFLLTLATLVSLIPEGLPAVVSIVLAIGVYRMSKKNAIIRHLPSAETSGSISVICVDKTGTLTRGEMMTQKLVTRNRKVEITGDGFKPQGSFLENGKEVNATLLGEVYQLLRSATLAVDSHLEQDSEGKYFIIGDPTEGSLVVAAEKAGIDRLQIIDDARDIAEYPFDSRYRYSASYIKGKDSLIGVLYVAGAPEDVLRKCSYVYDRGSSRVMREDDKAHFRSEHIRLSRSGLRVVGVAFKNLKQRPQSQESATTNLSYIGLCAMIDPPRENAKEAIRKARSAGARVIMITGDHARTAFEIARQIEITEAESRVLEGKDVDSATDAELREMLENIDVVARATPRSKLRIIKSLQEDGEIVAMTGDGVNDAPALRQADIGIAMGITGTDVSKDASQMVLMDDNFASIVDAIEEGRVILRNMRQTTAFLLTTNMGEGIIILASLLLNAPLVLLPIQILFLNLVAGGMTDVALAMEGNHHDTMRDKRLVKNNSILTKEMIPYFIIVVGLMLSFSLLIFFHYLPEGVDKARTAAFVTMAFFQLWNVLNMRSLSSSVFSIGLFTNKYVIISLIFSVGLTVAMVHTAIGQKLFSLEPLSIVEWSVIALISSSVFWASEAWKLVRKLFFLRAY